MMPGLGKTLATLAAVEHLNLHYGLVLVIAPPRCCVNVWPEEMDLWMEGVDYTHLTGSSEERIELIEAAEDGFLFLSYDLILWAIAEYPRLFARIDMLILDESTKLKSWKAKKYKALKKVVFQIPRVVELTGTPAPNGLLGIWSQLFLLDRGARLGKFITHYKNKYFDQDYLGFTFTPKKPKRIYKKVEGIVYALRNTQYRDMVKQVHIKVQSRTSRYNAMKSKSLVTLLVDGEKLEIAALSKAVQGNKLRQLSNGFIYDEFEIPHDIHNEKIQAAKDLVDELSGQPLIIFYEFKRDLERLKKAFPKATVFSDKAVKKWNAGQIEVMLMSPWSAGHGLNLQGGGHQVCWMSPPFDLEVHEQANARVARKGQKAGGVLAYYIVGEGTIDEYVLAVLKLKDATQADLMKALEKAVK
jgi:SNF2 family DNA or RNA helicase